MLARRRHRKYLHRPGRYGRDPAANGRDDLSYANGGTVPLAAACEIALSL